LYHEAISSPHILQHSYKDISFTENLSLTRSQFHSQGIRDSLSENGIAGTSQDRKVAHR